NAASKRKLWIASALCFMFFVVELVGGILSGSLAILSDSFHLLSDLLGFSISLFAIYISQRKATKQHSFGFHRAEILGALASVMMIWCLTSVLVFEAVERIKNPEPINADLMLLIASLGVGVNLMYVKVYASMCTHENINVKAAVIHVIGDIVSSVGVLVSSIILKFQPTWVIVDPICTFFFSIIVLYTTFNIIKDSFVILMEGTPTHIDPYKVENDLLTIPLINRVHDLHIWNLSVGKIALAVHLEVDYSITNQEYEEVLERTQELVCKRYGIHHTTVQVE
ncbi:cation efflux protein, partial [Paraphysoderma sedebokerense]